MRTYIGIDNGCTGSVGIVKDGEAASFPTPTLVQQDYTKKKQNITRVDTVKLSRALRGHQNPFCLIERPMVNPGRFKATLSAMRALEATLCVLEQLEIPYQFIDSKEWQKAFLPKGVQGPELKKASRDLGTRLFPALAKYFKGDADGILIAEFAKRQNL